MLEKEYTLTFTGGAGLIPESVKTAGVYCEYLDWDEVRESIITDNAFQCRTQSTLIKLYREVQRRLVMLSDEEIALLATGSEADKHHVAWLAICLKYRLIRDFAVEVVLNRYDIGQYALSYAEYDQYFDHKSDLFDNLANASTTTKKKARQVIFKMMSECGLLNNRQEIQPQYLSEHFRTVVRAAGHERLLVFPGMGVR